MKRVIGLVIVQVAFAACTVFKAREREREKTAYYAERKDSAAMTTQSHYRWQALDRAHQYDSFGFSMLINTQGGYRLHPDSGIFGDSATIWIGGQRQQWMSRQRDVESAGKDSTVQKQGASEVASQARSKTLAKTVTWSPVAGWTWLLLALVLVAVGWWWLRKK